MRGKVLALGAGRDPYRSWYGEGARVWNTDVENFPPVIHCVADAHELPFADESFDWAVALEVFEHLRRPRLAARELHRVLARGGRALISVPFMFRVHGDPRDFARFTEWGLRELFAGFPHFEVHSFGGRIHVVSDLITTSHPVFVPGRVLNHALTWGPLGRIVSHDCPSGFVVSLTKVGKGKGGAEDAGVR
jgi:SAM-dependent methyltransferase